MPDAPALVIFARAPLPGHTKTRLIPSLGADGAAALYRCFLLDTLAQAARAPAQPVIAAAAADHVPALRALAAEAGLEAEVTIQSDGDLGARMCHAFQEAFARGHSRAVIVGSDSPSLPPARVAEALAQSAARDLVLGPSFDGGYYLIGLRAAPPRLFAGIAWSQPTVLLETLRRACELGLSVSLLDPWYDVDTPEDLARLRTHLAALALAGQEIPCPRTWQHLAAWPEGDGA
jgi:rSAM/selenodomain-associated transferase 1